MRDKQTTLSKNLLMKITQRLAEDLAKMLTAKKDAAINKARKELSEFADKVYLKSIPKEVVDFFAKHKSYVNETSYIQVSGKGINYERVNLSKSFPSKGYNNSVLPTDKECEKFRVLIDNKKTLEKSKDELYRRTEQALLQLSTSKRVAEQFPELTDYLNKLDNGKLVPVANIEQLKKELRTT